MDRSRRAPAEAILSEPAGERASALPLKLFLLLKIRKVKKHDGGRENPGPIRRAL
jgi:hypothetical protein